MAAITVDGPLERGQRPRITVVWYDRDEVVWAGSDPTVTCSVLDPAGVTTTPTPTKVNAATWYVDIDLTAAERWSVRFVASGALVAAASGSFYVSPGPFD